uniref:Uncharacterized protein n=1 Tax=Tanacetum cinerariifolium TaxID=118510 RepID=A0A6L2KZX9_TANCI|nr:hypothetical protein [Tanacetum cinerariifolium]
MHEKKYFNRNLANHALYHALIEALAEDENTMDKGVADTIKNHKRQHDDSDDDDDEDPLAGPNQSKKTKRRRTKESESSKKTSTTKETPKVKALSKGSKTDKLDWNNPERDRYPFYLSKHLPLQGCPGDLTIAADYLFNNDPEFLKTSDPEKMYTTSITKTKATRYEIESIEDMVLTLWNTIKHAHNVFSTQKILGVKGVSVKKLHGYGYLEEVAVKRADRQLYRFKEGNFVDLHLNDIEDMLLLAVQHKLLHLNESDIVDFIVALHMFTRSLIIKRRVEDLHLGVESYQKKLNITTTQQTFLEIEFKELYTPSYKPPGKVLGVKSVNVKKLHGYGHLEEVMVKRAD